MRLKRLVRYPALIAVAALYSCFTWAQTSVTPLNTVDIGVTLPGNQGVNATDNPVSVPVVPGTATSLFRSGNIIKIDSEYLLITAVGSGSLIATRAQLGSTAAAHNASAPILRVYQLDVMLSSPNAGVRAYQLNVSYDSSRLAIVPGNVFPGTGTLGNPIAINTNTPGTVILNSFTTDTPFQGGPTSVARLYFTGSNAGTANISVNLTNLGDTNGVDLDSAANSVTAPLSASSLTVMMINTGIKQRRGQITSQ